MTKLVDISGLNIRFTGERTVYAVNDLSLSLGDGEVLGLLGESGSGKSVTLRALMRLLPKKRTQISGKVNVMGRDVLAMNDEELSSFRGQTVSMIFQEPALALDPVYTIGAQIAESVVRHEGKSLAEGRARGARNARGRAHSLGQAAAGCLSARDVRRHAPARDDRAGARLPSQDLAGG
ncbi:ABC-type dipeptide/oligopeptide/nickel transport system ATPase component [Bradyrhizobium sp. i1.7.7]